MHLLLASDEVVEGLALLELVLFLYSDLELLEGAK